MGITKEKKTSIKEMTRHPQILIRAFALDVKIIEGNWVYGKETVQFVVIPKVSLLLNTFTAKSESPPSDNTFISLFLLLATTTFSDLRQRKKKLSLPKMVEAQSWTTQRMSNPRFDAAATTTPTVIDIPGTPPHSSTSSNGKPFFFSSPTVSPSVLTAASPPGSVPT